MRDLNDALRTSFFGGRWILTTGVLALGAPIATKAVRSIQAFDGFTPDNDPYGEHDFGSIVVEGHTLFWKIDYLDKQLEYGSPDPTNPEVTERVLTLMLASEY
nr:DUF3768 domain-containing protein [Pelagibacterium montanilacus]